MKILQQPGVVGTGMIGASMATLFVGNGYPTLMRGTSEASCQNGVAAVRRNFDILCQQGLVSKEQALHCLNLLRVTVDYAPFESCDFVLEAVLEDLEVKQEVFRNLEHVCGRDTVIASATSSIPAAQLAALLQSSHRFLIAHPINPPHLVPLVEISTSDATCEESIQATCEFLERCGKQLLVLQKDIEGFVINRLQHALFREALYLIEQGVCSAEEINDAFLCSLGPRYASIGLFEHYDAAGLPLQKEVQGRLFPTLCCAEAPQKPLLEHLEKGHLGLSTGQGVLDWSHKDLDEFRARQSAPFYRFFNYRLPK